MKQFPAGTRLGFESSTDDGNDPPGPPDQPDQDMQQAPQPTSHTGRLSETPVTQQTPVIQGVRPDAPILQPRQPQPQPAIANFPD